MSTSAWPDALPAEPATLARLHDRLTAAAVNDGTLDLAYRTLDSPLGELLLVATPAGLVRVAFPGEGHEQVLTDLAVRISPRVLRAPARLDAVAHQLADYFAGRRRAFDVTLDLQLARGYRREVLDHLRDIGYGHTETYRQVAVATGRPTAVRAVGTACATNPLPLVVPCHRVLRSDGALGGYLGGLAAKQQLLALEAA